MPIMIAVALLGAGVGSVLALPCAEEGAWVFPVGAIFGAVFAVLVSL